MRRVECVAFAMGPQERLGAGSVQELDAGVMPDGTGASVRVAARLCQRSHQNEQRLALH